MAILKSHQLLKDIEPHKHVFKKTNFPHELFDHEYSKSTYASEKLAGPT